VDARRAQGRVGRRDDAEEAAEAQAEEALISATVTTHVAVISDTHLPRGARRLPEACLRELRDADAILHAGDIASVGAYEALCALGPPVYAVVGNVDEPALGEVLPEERVVELGGVTFGMRHIAVSEESLLERFPGCAAVVFGHSHLPVVERRGAVWLLNPGSPTERRRAPFHSMIVVRIGGGELFPELLRLT
jgi:putative phosphoesterase